MAVERRTRWLGAGLALALMLAMGIWYVVETYVNGPVPTGPGA